MSDQKEQSETKNPKKILMRVTPGEKEVILEQRKKDCDHCTELAILTSCSICGDSICPNCIFKEDELSGIICKDCKADDLGIDPYLLY